MKRRDDFYTSVKKEELGMVKLPSQSSKKKNNFMNLCYKHTFPLSIILVRRYNSVV